jgi:hypothetical protein
MLVGILERESLESACIIGIVYIAQTHRPARASSDVSRFYDAPALAKCIWCGKYIFYVRI